MADTQQLTVGSLFAGIGGFDLGFERAGMRTVWFCEQDAYCQAVLAKHWPGVPIFDDVRTLVADPGGVGRERRSHRQGDHAQAPEWSQAVGDLGVCDTSRGNGFSLPVPVPPVDVLCGGFPCQDLSSAGRQAGLTGDRSGLWFEYLRLIGELRPRYVVVENVPQLRKYLDVVTGGLAEIGYDAEWDVISAADFGAPHLRKRLWLVGYPNRAGLEGHGRPVTCPGERAAAATGRGSRAGGVLSGWAPEPDVGRVAHGVPSRVDRLRALGNALVPPIAEYIGRQIVAHEAVIVDG